MGSFFPMKSIAPRSDGAKCPKFPFYSILTVDLTLSDGGAEDRRETWKLANAVAAGTGLSHATRWAHIGLGLAPSPAGQRSRRSDAMCREHVDLAYLRREAEQQLKETGRQTAPAPAPAAEPVGGLVAVLRGLFERVRPAKTTVPAK